MKVKHIAVVFVLSVYLVFTFAICVFHQVHGRNVQVVIEQPLQHGDSLHEGRNTVTYEARQLKGLFLRVL